MTAVRDCCLCANSSWAMKHVVWINMSGKTVLVFGGVFLLVHPVVDWWSRFAGGLNLVGMLFGQLWYSSYWTIGKGEGVDQFVKDSGSAHPLTDFPFGDDCSIATSGWIFAASMYYVAFTVLFYYAYTKEHEDNTHVLWYDVAACIWHGWVLLLLWWALIMQVCGRSTHTSNARKTDYTFLEGGDSGEGVEVREVTVARL